MLQCAVAALRAQPMVPLPAAATAYPAVHARLHAIPATRALRQPHASLMAAGVLWKTRAI